MARAIWQDYKVELGNEGDAVPYTIKVDGEVVFNGRAYALPGEGAPCIYLNRIVRDYLSAKAENLFSTSVSAQPHYLRMASVEYGDEAMAESFICDYGYDDYIRTEAVQSLSRPLSNVVDCRQRLVTSFVNFGRGTLVELADGRGATLAESDNGRCNTFAYNLNGGHDGEVLSVVANQGFDTLREYEVRRTCATHALYYLNAHGGYDHLLIKGNVLRTDDYTRTEMRRDVDNTTLAHSRQYVSTEVQSKWRLYTDYLTDEQWALTHHLLGSSHIFLHDLEADTITPVVITSNSADFKTYRNQGKKKSYLTIDVEASAKRIRK